MIAERAGLSPGGVFTTFDDKIAILCQILAEQREHLFEEIEMLTPRLTGDARDRIHSVMTLAHAHEWPRLRMVIAYIGASYGWSRKLEDEHRHLHRRLSKVMGEILTAAVERGEIDQKADLELLVEMISSVYLRNYRTAFYAGFDADDLNDRVGRQLDLLFNGARPRLN